MLNSSSFRSSYIDGDVYVMVADTDKNYRVGVRTVTLGRGGL